MGSRGRIKLELENDLKVFCRNKNLKGYISHSGWISVKSIRDSHILAKGEFETVSGTKSGPVVALLKRGNGEAIYTSYHKKRGNEEISRYIIYRLTYRYLLDTLEDKAFKWEQKIQNSIVDSIRKWERYRIYAFALPKGENTIYLTSKNGLFQLDLYDKDNHLIISKDNRQRDFSIDIKSYKDDYYILKVYSSLPGNSEAYSIVTAHGIRIFPYYIKISLGLLLLLLPFVLKKKKKIMGPKRISCRYSRLRQK